MTRSKAASDDGESAGRIRLDKWLWYARLTKTRALAQRMLQAGHARINGRKTTSASVKVSPGDVITLVMHPQSIHATVLVIRIIACGERRGPFREAQRLYETVKAEGEQPPV